MAESRQYKSINFDLSTERLRKVFGEGGRRKAYAQIQRFLTRNGFEHRQWSGYVTTERRLYTDIYVVLDGLKSRCSWLSRCTNRFDVTDFMAESDMLGYIVAEPKLLSDDDLGGE
jgi:virulence-associated protein VapD